MITAEKCRIRAAECKALASSIDIPTQRSLEQSTMALNWEALDDRFHETGIDEPNIHGTRSVLADSSFENG